MSSNPFEQHAQAIASAIYVEYKRGTDIGALVGYALEIAQRRLHREVAQLTAAEAELNVDRNLTAREWARLGSLQDRLTQLGEDILDNRSGSWEAAALSNLLDSQMGPARYDQTEQ